MEQAGYWIQHPVIITPYLYMPAVMTPGWKLDPPEGDRALEGHLDGRLLHAVLTIGPWCPRDGPTAEVALDWEGEGERHQGSEPGPWDRGGTVVAPGQHFSITPILLWPPCHTASC